MGFDPQEWLRQARAGAGTPAPAAPASFDPQAWLARARQEQQPGPWASGYQTEPKPNIPRLPEPEPPEEPSAVGAAALGAASGATSGFLDEIAGTLGAYGVNVASISGGGGMGMVEASLRNRAKGDPTGRQTYREGRDAIRGEQKAAREAHPWAYGVSEFAGAVAAPGPKGVLAGAGLGGAYGVGASEGETLAEVAADAGKGALTALAVGGALKGAGKVVKKVIGGAAGRVEKRATDALLEGTPAKTVQDPALAALGGKAGLTKALKEEGLLGKPASKIDAALTERMDEVGGKLGAIYQKVDETQPGVPPEFVRDKLMALAQKFRSDPDSADAIRSYANRLAAEYTDEGAMSAQELHKAVKALGKRGYGTNPQNPSMSAELKREIRGEVLAVLQQHVDDVSKGAGTAGTLAELRSLNQQYRRLINMDNVAASKAQRDERMSPTLGQRAGEVVRGVANMGSAGGAIASLAAGEPTLAAASIAAGAAVKYGPQLAAAADKLAANVSDSRLANWLRGSGSVQELLARAVQVGIPREVAMQAVGSPDQPQQQDFGSPLPGPPAPLLSGR